MATVHLWRAAAGLGRDHFAVKTSGLERASGQRTRPSRATSLSICSAAIDGRSDTLYDDPLPKSSSKLDQRFDHDSRIRIVPNIAHEPAVQLQRVDAGMVKNAERPAPRAQVVDRDAYTAFSPASPARPR
ncbi:hypothetical protein QFZ94_000681 [Paraburkholderia sp. JPY465]